MTRPLYTEADLYMQGQPMSEMEHLIREVADLRHAVELSGKLLDNLCEQMRLHQEAFENAMRMVMAERMSEAALKSLLDKLTKPGPVM